jgi:hypothetical protein
MAVPVKDGAYRLFLNILEAGPAFFVDVLP